MTQPFRVVRVPMSQIETGDHVQSPLGAIFKVHGKRMSWGNGEPPWTLTSEHGNLKVQGDGDTLVNKVVPA